MSSSQKDNWRELAEMLGLSVDEPAPAPPAPVPAAPKAESPEPPAAKADDFTADFSEQAAHSVLEPEDRERFEAQFEDVVVEGELVEVDDDIDEAKAPQAESPEGEQPQDERRGRRRGRRGRRRGRGEGDDATENAAPPENAGEERRGQRAPRPAPVAANASEDDDDVDRPIADVDDQDDFSQDAWADWNVPNWQELIDGLHRP